MRELKYPVSSLSNFETGCPAVLLSLYFLAPCYWTWTCGMKYLNLHLHTCLYNCLSYSFSWALIKPATECSYTYPKVNKAVFCEQKLSQFHLTGQ